MHQIKVKVKSHLFDGFLAGWTACFALGVPVFWLFGSPPRAIRSATRLLRTAVQKFATEVAG
jgi:1-acyl-sn-glycerol-3-phosphate acyltransferase